MVERLVEQGIIRSVEWRKAFSRVPREHFVPRFYEREGDWGSPTLIDGADPTQREGWLQLVHDADETMVTQIDPASGAPTSSSTMPRIVAAMLEALEVAPEQRVLEIGTGTGYSTALLCERLGSANVTSVDVDAGLVELARRRLADLGHSPHVVASDGFQGCPDRAPYDRVIATCQVARLPLPWVRQCCPRGLIVAVLPDCMIRLTPDGTGGAAGRMHTFPVGFMWMRGHSPTRVSAEELAHLTQDGGEARESRVGVMAVLRGEEIPSLWPVALTTFLPHYVRVPAPRGQIAFTDMTDRSWVRLRVDGSEVIQGGPRLLWDGIEDLYHLLDQMGRPQRDRFGLTVRPDSSQFLWLDSPESEYQWELR